MGNHGNSGACKWPDVICISWCGFHILEGKKIQEATSLHPVVPQFLGLFSCSPALPHRTLFFFAESTRCLMRIANQGYRRKWRMNAGSI